MPLQFLEPCERPGERSRFVSAVLVALVIVVILYYSRGHSHSHSHSHNYGVPWPWPWPKRYVGGAPRERLEASPDGATFHPDAPQRRSVHAALSRLHSTADVDPLVTGQLYGHADNVRNVYAQRTSHGDVWGLTEYSSSGGAGDVGVDEGPFGLEEYGGRQVGYDDGIPEAWALPSTPTRWYRPAMRDYYGPEGPTVYSEGLFSLTVPDHDPLMN